MHGTHLAADAASDDNTYLAAHDVTVSTGVVETVAVHAVAPADQSVVDVTGVAAVVTVHDKHNPYEITKYKLAVQAVAVTTPAAVIVQVIAAALT